jgi:hypothetical protein
MELEAWQRWWKQRGRYGLNRILLDDWNPIGFEMPLDEYSGYAGTVARMLREGAREHDIAQYLGEARTGNIGLDPDPAGDAAAAMKCVAYFTDEMRMADSQEK